MALARLNPAPRIVSNIPCNMQVGAPCHPSDTQHSSDTSSAPAEDAGTINAAPNALALLQSPKTPSVAQNGVPAPPAPCRCHLLTLAWLCPQRNEAAAYSRPSRFGDGFHTVLLTFIVLACVAGIAIAASAAFCLRRHAKQREKERLAALGPEGAADTTLEYQVGPCGMRDPAGCSTTASASLGAALGQCCGQGTRLLLGSPRSCAASTWLPSLSLAVLRHRQRQQRPHGSAASRPSSAMPHSPAPAPTAAHPLGARSPFSPTWTSPLDT